MEGAMVALSVPPEVGKKLRPKDSDAEPLERLHITLAYFTDKAADRDDWDKAEEIVRDHAAKIGALKGKITGYGIFTGDEGDILWACPSVPGMTELWFDLTQELEDAGFPISKEFGFTPHITLLYGFSGSLPKLEKPIEVTFDDLCFAKGEDYKPFPFKKQSSSPTTFSTDGKNVVFDSNDFSGLYPPEDGDHRAQRENLLSGTLHPTSDGLGYRVEAEGWNDDRPSPDQIIALLDEETGKPCHFG